MVSSNLASPGRATQLALEKFRILAEYAPDALVIVDQAGRILHANESAEGMFGYPPRELVGEMIEVLVPEGDRRAHRELRPRYAEYPHSRAMGAMRELHGRRKDGTTFPVEISLRPLESEGVTLICSSIRDVSDRVAIAAQLRASEELFRTLVHQSTDGIFITDLSGRYQEVNPAGCEMLGYARDEILAMSIADIVVATEVPRIADEIRKLESGEPVRSEWEFRRRDGSTFFGEVHARHLSDSRLLANVRDITSRRAIETELRASKHFIEAVANASAPVIYVFDLRAMVLSYANRSILVDLGYPEPGEPVTLDRFKTVMPAEEMPHLDRVLREWYALADGDRREDEYRLRDASGVVRWFLGRETVFARAADGTVGQVLGTLYDITTRKLAEQALDHSRALLQSFVEHTPAAVAMFDKHLRYLAVSRRWLQDYGLGDRNLVGEHHYDVFPEIGRKPDWLDVHQRCLAGAVERRDEDLFVRADGHTDWLRWEVRPWRDELGAIGGIIMFTEVITDRKLAEARVRESQMHLVASQHVAGVGSWELDLPLPHDRRTHARVQWSDECLRILGYQPGEVEIAREAFFDRVHPDDLKVVQDVVNRAIESGTPFSFDHRIVLHDGAERLVHQQGEIVLNPTTGKPSKLIGTVQDITERRRLEERLRQSEKLQAIGRLAGGVAHDFNNALTVITGVTEMLLDRLPPGDGVREDVIAVRDAADQATSLTRQLLLFSRKAVVQPRVVDCNALVTRMSQMLKRVIGEDIVLSTTLEPSLGKIRADVSQVEQVIMNLALNARDAMPQGGRMMIETKDVVLTADECREHPECTPGHYALLVIRDTGTGMTPHVKTHLFEPFFTTKGAGRGTGLGLATVYGIVQQTGGFITVTSELDVGTTFNVFLPAIESHETTPVPPATTDGRLRGTETVLLVEDDDSVRHLVKIILEKYGYQVLEAANGKAAIRVSDEHAWHIDLLLSDVIMPEMSGPDLAIEVVKRRPGIRVLLMSGYEEGRIAAGPYQELGPFIQKPFRPAELAARIRDVLDQPRADS